MFLCPSSGIALQKPFRVFVSPFPKLALTEKLVTDYRKRRLVICFTAGNAALNHRQGKDDDEE
jgi:hypothetical protein